MGMYTQSFPVHSGPGSFEILDDAEALPVGAEGKMAFRYRKEQRGGGPGQWIGWQEPGFQGKHVQMSFWIKVRRTTSYLNPKDGPLEPNGCRETCSFVRSADALDGAPQQTPCEESVVRLLSLTVGSAIESLPCQGHQRHGGDIYQPRLDT